MKANLITEKRISAFAQKLRQEERSLATLEKYLRDVAALAQWLHGRPVTKELAAAWKTALLENGLAPSTVNTKLAAVTTFSSAWAGRSAG